MTLNRRATSFVPSARLLSILGEQLLSDPVVGLLELVKNGHDADATLVEIETRRLKGESAEIVVSDDGFGMSAEDVEKRFLVPATGKKARQKELQQRTPGGRLPLGEKGIGRFATQAIARKLELVTRKKGHPEVVLEIDWDRFESEAALHEVEMTIEERPAQVFTGDWTGTRLTMRGLRQKWGYADLERLQSDLRRLKSPFPKFGLTAFDIKFSCRDFPIFEDVESVDLEAMSHYKFKARVDEGGGISYEYTCQHPSDLVTAYTFKQGDPVALDLEPDSPWTGGASKSTLEKLRCGPVSVTLYVFDREARYLKEIRRASGVDFSRTFLDAICGISVFRDDMRVLPYGEPGNDWLKLDQLRINSPSGHIGNKQVVGYVELSQEGNTNLKEKADRYGLQENAAFRDLRRVVVAAISQFLEHWSLDRPKGQRRQTVKNLKANPQVELITRRIKVSDPPSPRRKASEEEFEEEFDAAGSIEGLAAGVETQGYNPGTRQLVVDRVGGDAESYEVEIPDAGPADVMVALPGKMRSGGKVRPQGIQPSPLVQPLLLRMLSHAATDLEEGINFQPWSELFRDVAAIAGAPEKGAVRPAVDRVLALLQRRWKHNHLKTAQSGDSFVTSLSSGYVVAIMYGALLAAEEEVQKRPAAERSVNINFNSFNREVRLTWFPSRNTRGPAPQGRTICLVGEIAALATQFGGSVVLRSEDYNLGISLPYE